MEIPASPEVELWVETAGLEDFLGLKDLPDPVVWNNWFSSWFQELNPNLSPINRYEVSVLLTNDSTIQELNSTYRYQDKATDVLAFATQETEAQCVQVSYQAIPMPLGDVVISVETAQRQRHSSAFSLTQEIAWLSAHGLLHLLGWDHPDDISLEKMLDQQMRLLTRVNLTN